MRELEFPEQYNSGLTNRRSIRFDKLLEFHATAEPARRQTREQSQSSQGRPINRDQFIGRLDFVESSNSQWFGRYSWGDENLLNRDPSS